MSLDSYLSSFLSFTVPFYSTYSVLKSEEKKPSYVVRDAVESDLAKLIVYSCAAVTVYKNIDFFVQ